MGKVSRLGVKGVAVLWFCAANAALAGKLAKNPSIISLIYYEPGENFSSSFGHVDLRISYGKVPSVKNDIAVGFGPEVKAGFNPGPLQFVGIGKKLDLISWTETFETSYFNASRERMVGVISMELDLTPAERNRVVDSLNVSLESKNPPSYHAILRNCASEIGLVLQKFSRIKKGWFAFHPGFLEKNLSRYTRERHYYPSGRLLKQKILEEHRREYRHLFVDETQRQILEAQLMSAKTEFRILAYRKLLQRGASRALAEALYATESPRRLPLMKKHIEDAAYPTHEFSTSDPQAHRLLGVKVEKSRLLLEYENPVLGSPTKRLLPTTTRASWDAKTLGLRDLGGAWREGFLVSGKRIHFWITRDLNVDPK
ncbi:MAG TPA: DUF4105 domain-containing protein [Bdellovibrionota bacterium]|jgi:hypothetical protein|nr:DUF4105 domain-containing protein [Bdellovibrionota bacterium]